MSWLLNSFRFVAGAAAYVLQATFTASNHTFSDGDDAETAAPGSVEAGNLTIELVGTSTIEVLTNELSITKGTAPGWTHGFHSNTLTRSLGLTAKMVMGHTGDDRMGFIGFGDGTGTLSTATPEHGFQPWEGGRIIYAVTPNLGNAVNVGVYTDVDHEYAVIVGGYNSSGTPYQNGDTKANFTYGASYFVKGGSFTNWTLLWRHSAGQVVASPNVVHLGGIDATAYTIDNVVSPPVTYEALLEPVVLDTFTDTNGTALTAHTPDVDTVGTGWEAITNLFDIQSNKTTTNSVQDNVAVIDTGLADCLIGVTANYDTSNKYPAIMFRVTDADNMWYAQNTNELTFEMIERTAATNTSRASVAKTFTGGVDYDYTVILDGSNITAFVDGGSKLSYSSSVRSIVTKHGIRAFKTETTFDNFAVYPRGTASRGTLVAEDTFTDTNGVSLDAHTMDTGSGWTEHAGTWEIQSNQLTEQIGASAEYSASFDSGDADVTVEANVNIGSSSTSQMGLGLRVTDNNNLWQIRLIKAATGMRIYEKVAGTPTLRASGGNVVNSVDYKVTVIAEGQDITCFLDGGSKLTYGSATFNETNTNHGVFSALAGAGAYIDNLAVYPVTYAYSDLDNY